VGMCLLLDGEGRCVGGKRCAMANSGTSVGGSCFCFRKLDLFFKLSDRAEVRYKGMECAGTLSNLATVGMCRLL
jgi:hypothetical protein